MPDTLPSVSAVIVAAGSGTRFGGERPKQLALLAGRPVLSRTLQAFEASRVISEIILVLPADWLETIIDEAVKPYGLTGVKCVPGGENRTESTRRGFEVASGAIILVHDGVRPLVKVDLIEKVARAAWEHSAALAAVLVSDTLKKVKDGLVSKTVDRDALWRAQTPQGFKRDLLASALAGAQAETATDDVGLVERLGLTAFVVPGSLSNFKITDREDLAMAEALLSSAPAKLPRTGHGYDLHRLAPGRPLFLAGVEIPFELGLLGHSDADVMAHALVDAILGAAGLGDIGLHFPDSQARWAGVSGSALLKEAMAKARAAGFELVNADVTLVGERPKIGPYRQAMAEAVALALSVPANLINIKATTTEGLESTGQGLALAALATATVQDRR